MGSRLGTCALGRSLREWGRPSVTRVFGSETVHVFSENRGTFSSTRNLKTYLFLIPERGLFPFLFNFWKSGAKPVTDTRPGPFANPQVLRGGQRPSRKQGINPLLEVTHLGTKVKSGGPRVGPRMLWERSRPGRCRVTKAAAAVEDLCASRTGRALQTWPSHEQMPLNP